jgi:hypothetical protein
MNKYNSKIAKVFGFVNGQKRYAVTFGQTAYYSVSKEEVLKSPNWIKHENRHKEQYAKEGVLKFAVKYIWYSIRYGYKANPYEIDARQAEL